MYSKNWQIPVLLQQINEMTAYLSKTNTMSQNKRAQIGKNNIKEEALKPYSSFLVFIFWTVLLLTAEYTYNSLKLNKDLLYS